MRTQVLNIYAMTLDASQKLMTDIPCERCAELPFDSAKHPGWVLGHLSIASGMIAAYLGGEEGISGVPEDWMKSCAPGVPITADRGQFGTRDQLMSEMVRVHALAAERFGNVSDADLAKPFPNPDYRAFWPTLADGAFYLLAYHEGYHLGQLSSWRRAVGFGPAPDRP